MFRFRSRLAEARAPGAGRSLLLIAAVLALSALWTAASRRPRPALERFAAAGLAHVAGLGMAHLVVAVADGGRLHAWATPALLAASAAGAAALLRKNRGRRSGAAPPAFRFTPWDAASAFFLLSLLVPTVFPYIHYDAMAIWACRAFGFANTGNLAAVADCRCPNYPPLDSILLWLGVSDPLFQGRLLPWLALVLFALLFRARAERLVGPNAPVALLFLVSTVNVWQGTAMYYANVPAMVFLSAGALLAWGVPSWEPTPAERAVAALLLGAAVLLRPDGLLYVGVLAAAAISLRAARGRRVALAPLAAGAACALLWAARPAAFHAPHDFFSHATAEWRQAGESAPGAAARVVGIFLDGVQGQWLSHKGFGAAMFLLAGAAFVRARRPKGPRRGDDVALFGTVALGGLLAVALCYLAIPFFGDVWDAAQPFDGTWAEAYLHFLRVGVGRMTVHLYPFAVLYGAGAFQGAASRAVPCPANA